MRLFAAVFSGLVSAVVLLATVAPRVPREITLEGHVPSRRALWLLRLEQGCWRNVEVRTSRYLNNIIEQAHRAIKP